MSETVRTTKQLGAAIRSARTRRGWTQGDLAERVGVSQPALSAIEAGNPATRVDRILAILAALDLDATVDDRKPADWSWSGVGDE